MPAETADEFLEHFGVKGMKWGVSASTSKGGGPSASTGGTPHFGGGQSNKTAFVKGGLAGVAVNSYKNRKESQPAAPAKPKKEKVSSQDVKDARGRQEIRLRKYQEAEGDLFVARTAKGQAKAEKVMRQMENDFFNSKDAATAARMTRGEKISTGLMLGSIAASAVLLAGAR